MRLGTIAFVTGVVWQAVSVSAATYYVSPRGDDTANGTSAEHAWKTCKKVLDTKFTPGDSILFERGGEWRERLEASSNGTADKPITYDAYGEGAKPKFWGSDLLENAKFTPVGANQYSYKITPQADTALRDQTFIPATYADGALTITSDTDPRNDGKKYTACTRGNVIFSARKNHLIFRNLVVDETAGQLNEGAVQGYGVRIEGSTNVLLEDVETYRCGRHHFAAINTTEFVGRRLVARFVQPETPGDNTPYVSYADQGAPVAKCTTTWDDIIASNMDNGKGGQYVMFVSHGDHLGLITMMNSTATTKISFMSAPVVVKNVTLKETASIENFGEGITIDGVKLEDSSALDQYGSNGTIQNCVANMTPTGGGATGYGAAIVFRDKAKDNVVRFNTLATKNFAGVMIVGANSATKWYGNIFAGTDVAVARANEPLQASDVAMADYNFYSTNTNINGHKFPQWNNLGFDANSKSGDPGFVDAASSNFNLSPNSPCINAAAIKADDVPDTDAAGKPRDKSGTTDIGAYSTAK